MLATILKILAGIVSYFSNRQLIESGRALEKADVLEANKKAQELADKQVDDANNIWNDPNIDDDFLLPPSERNR